MPGLVQRCSSTASTRCDFCDTAGVPRPRPRDSRVTPKGTRPQDRQHDDHRDTDLARPEAVLLRDARSMMEPKKDEGLFEADDWASSIQVLFRPTGPSRTPVAEPSAVLDVAHDDGGAGGALLATALAVYGPTEIRADARRVADQLIAGRTDLSEWLLQMGQVTPGRCLRFSDIWDDSFSLLLDYECDATVRGVGVQIDTIGGGLAGGFLHGPTTHQMKEKASTDEHAVITDIDPADARAILEAAIVKLDAFVDPGPEDDPGENEDRSARALVEHRFAQLPAGGRSELHNRLSEGGREAAIAAFLRRPSATLLTDAADIADTICTFSTYCDGDPFRWSPARVETFLAGWIPHKIEADDSWYRNVPHTLREWLRYSAERVELRADGLEINLQMVDSAMGLMQQGRRDVAAGSPGTNITQEMIAAGVDQTNLAEVQAWVDQYNARSRRERP